MEVDLLVSRGMRIDDPKRANRYLSHLNYYGLAAYWLPFEQDHPTHRFKKDFNFNIVKGKTYDLIMDRGNSYGSFAFSHPQQF